MSKTIIETSEAPLPIGPYSQAILASKTLYISGQIALSAADGTLQNKDIQEETHQVMHNIKAILKAANMDFDNIVKTTIYLSSMDLFTEVNEIYNKYFSGNFPARETIAVLQLPKNANIEISAIAVK